MELPSAGSLLEGQQDAWLYSEISFRHSWPVSLQVTLHVTTSQQPCMLFAGVGSSSCQSYPWHRKNSGARNKFILSLSYRSEVRYKQRLLKTGLLPLCYWHELLDLVYVFKFLVSLSDSFTSVINSTRPRRNPGALSPPMVRCWIRLEPTLSPLRTVFTVKPQEFGMF